MNLVKKVTFLYFIHSPNAFRHNTGSPYCSPCGFTDNNVKILLSKSYTEVFWDEDIEHINNGTRSYSLVYNGRYPGGRSYKLSLEY